MEHLRQRSNVLGHQAGTAGIAAAALHSHHGGIGIHGGADAVDIQLAIGGHFHLRIADPHLLKGADAGALNADHFLQRIVGTAGSIHQLVAGLEKTKQAHAQGMGAGGDLRPDNSSIRLKQLSKDLLEGVTAHIIVAIARGGRKMTGCHLMALQRIQHLGGIVHGNLIHPVKCFLALSFCGLNRLHDFGIHGIHSFDWFSSAVRKVSMASMASGSSCLLSNHCVALSPLNQVSCRLA